MDRPGDGGRPALDSELAKADFLLKIPPMGDGVLP
jgi:hypothetical protein